MPTGFRVFLKRNMPPKEVMEGFKTIPASNIADCMGRHNALLPEIRLMTPPRQWNMVGAALTVKVCYGDNLLLHKALDMAGPGDVIVVANEGGRNRSLMGEIMYRQAERTGVSGIVIDGPIRDSLEISKGSVPLYATGSTPGGPYKEGPGEINVPVSCGSVMVAPGDIVVGDPDGVIVIPRRDGKRLLEEALLFQKKDREKLMKAKDGTAERSWVEKTLLGKGCEFIDDICDG